MERERFFLTKDTHPLFDQRDKELDHLTNNEFKKKRMEPHYTLLVCLYHSLPKEVIKQILQYSCLFNKYNYTARTLRRLYNAIKSREFLRFVAVYTEEYINDPKVSNYFEFCDKPPCPDWRFYELCSCENDCEMNVQEEEKTVLSYLVRYSRYNYAKECRCVNGKRYLAHKMIKLLFSCMSKYNQILPEGQRMLDFVTMSGEINQLYYPFVQREAEYEGDMTYF